MVSPRSMYVPMGNFIFCSISDIEYFHSEVELNAGQGMIAIDGNLVQANMSDGYDLSPVGLKLLAYFHRLLAKSCPGHFLHHPVVFHSIALFWRYF